MRWPVSLEDGIGLCGDQCISVIPQQCCPPGATIGSLQILKVSCPTCNQLHFNVMHVTVQTIVKFFVSFQEAVFLFLTYSKISMTRDDTFKI